MKMHFFESNVWICTHLFCTKLDEDTLLWIKYVVQMFCTFFFAQSSMKIHFFESKMWLKMFRTLFCTKLDEDALLWIKCMDLHTFVLHLARWRYASLNQICGSKCYILCFAQCLMKKHFFESNVWFCTHLFCTKPEEDTLLWIKCEVQMFCTFFAQISMKIRFFESKVWLKMFRTLFCTKLDEDVLLSIKCMDLHTFVLH